MRTKRGLWAWFLQRITALMLTVFLFMHVRALHFGTAGRMIDFRFVTERLQGPLAGWWTFFYLLFVPAAMFHGLNGLYGILLDYAPSVAFRRVMLVLVWIVGLGMCVFGYFGIRNLFVLQVS
jgi:succinate dehydrogenase / fumarate reductase membrane anchor subunit